MKVSKIKKPGLRIIKTVISAAICLIISKLTGGILRPYDMLVVAVLATQGDVAESLHEVKNRISSTIIGGLIGTLIMVMVYISKSDWLEVLLVPLGLFTILYFCSKLIGKSEFIIIACYTFFAITLDEPTDISWFYPLRVMANTIVASIVAMTVNLYTPREKNKVVLYKEK